MTAMVRKLELVPGFPDYLAARDGRIFSLLSGKFLQAYKNPDTGHMYVKIRNAAGFKVGIQVYRLVLFAFVGLAPEGTEGCHRDGKPENNALSNLRWGTRAENIEDYRRLNRKHWRAKLSVETAQAIRAALTGKRGETAFLAEKYGVSRYVICDIRQGRTYKEIKE